MPANQPMFNFFMLQGIYLFLQVAHSLNYLKKKTIGIPNTILKIRIQKNSFSFSFQVILALYIKSEWFWRQILVFVNKRHKIILLNVVNFNSWTFAVPCSSSFFICENTEPRLKLVYSMWMSPVIFYGLKYVKPKGTMHAFKWYFVKGIP